MKTERGWSGIKFVSENEEEKELLQKLWNSLKNDKSKDEFDDFENGTLSLITYW